MKLWPHQAQAIPLLRGGHQLLAFDPGTGKTLTALTAMTGFPQDRHLVIGPPGPVLTQWERWAKEQGMTPFVIRSSKDVRQNLSGYNLIITSYSLVIRKPVWCKLMGMTYKTLTLDESHMAKNPMAKCTQSIFGRRKGAKCIYRQAEMTWLLSGTPITKDPSDLWVPVSRLWPEILEAKQIESRRQWIEYFCQYQETPYGLRITGGKRLDELRDVLTGKVIRVRDDEVERPELITDTQYLDPHAIDMGGLDEEAMEALELVLLEIQHQKGEITPEQMQRLQDLQVVLATLRRRIGEAKAPDIAEYIADQVRAGFPKIIVFFTHVNVGATIQSILDGKNRNVRAVRVDGSLSQDARQALIDEFIHDPTCNVFLAQIQTMGTGVDGLQVANRVLIAEPAWTPSVNEQAFRRAARGGAKHKSVYGSYMVMGGSIDEQVMKVLARREDIIERVLG